MSSHDEIEQIRGRLDDAGGDRPSIIACIASARDVADAHPTCAEAWDLLGDCLTLAHLGDGTDIAEARAAYQRATEIAPSDPEMWISLGYHHYVVTDNYAEAERCFREALRLGGDGEAAMGLAQAVIEQGRFQDARAIVESLPEGTLCDAERKQLNDLEADVRWFQSSAE